MKEAPGYVEAEQSVIRFDDLIETAMRPYSMEELRILRDDLVAKLRKDSPAGTGELLAQIAHSAPRQEGAAFAAVMATTAGRPALRKRLGVLRTLSAYIHARELKAAPHASVSTAPPAISRSSNNSLSSALNLNPENHAR